MGRGLIKDLKKRVVSKDYPPYKQNPERRVSLFEQMIGHYIQRFSILSNKQAIISHLDDIVDMCKAEIQRIERND